MEGPPPEAPDWDAPLTLKEAAHISGLTYGYLRNMAAAYEKDPATGLQTKEIGARLHVTTRRWLDDFLRRRAPRATEKRRRGPGRPPKPLPPDYQPPPRRGRPPKARPTDAAEPQGR